MEENKMKQYKEFRDGFKNFINEGKAPKKRPINEAMLGLGMLMKILEKHPNIKYNSETNTFDVDGKTMTFEQLMDYLKNDLNAGVQESKKSKKPIVEGMMLFTNLLQQLLKKYPNIKYNADTKKFVVDGKEMSFDEVSKYVKDNPAGSNMGVQEGRKLAKKKVLKKA